MREFTLEQFATEVHTNKDYLAHLARGQEPSVSSYMAWSHLDGWKAAHEAGDAWALWAALDACSQTGLAPPAWASDALHAGLEAIRTGQKKGLGEAFPALTRKRGQAKNYRQYDDDVSTCWIIANGEARRGGLEQNAVEDAREEIAHIRGGKKPSASAVRDMIRDGENRYGRIDWPHARNRR
ncbi:MAG: hypothetical protein NXI12_02920 [Alphaproteobacteria bacterium]|nr:hypothetical protein [Alphaproteobacteria bacterium]